MERGDELLQRIRDDLKRLKILLRVFKRRNWNDLLGKGRMILQKIEIRSYTNFAVCE